MRSAIVRIDESQVEVELIDLVKFRPEALGRHFRYPQANYTDSYWSRNNEAESLSNRLRKNPGFKQVAEGPSLTTGSTDVTHRLRILKIGRHIEVEVNGKVVIKWDDPERPHGAGRIGLRSMEGVTMIAYDNFKVWQVADKRTR